MLKFKSTASRIVFLHIVAVSLTAVFMPLVLFWLLNQETRSLHQRAMSDQAIAIQRHLLLGTDGKWSLELPPILKAQFSEAYGRYLYAVLDQSGNVLFSSKATTSPLFPARPSSPRADYREVARGGRIISGVSFRSTVADRAVTIQVGEDLSHRDVLIDDIVANFFRRVGWITLPILLVLLAADIIIFRRAMRPLLQASNTAQSIGPTRTDIRIPSQNIPNEIRPLVEAVNQAFDRLDQGFRVQREFTADAAHELRTPLAILRTRLDSLTDVALKRELQKDIDSMGRIVSQLLEAAELDAITTLPADRTDLRAVCSGVVEMIAPLALKQGRNLALTGAELPVWICGSTEMLQLAIRNLVENAVNVAPPGTTIEVQVSDHGSVRVLDEGPGIIDAEQKLIFQRFWRRDRRRDGSAGLGLSIVQRIVDAHGGTISVDNRPTGGASFKIQLISSKET